MRRFFISIIFLSAALFTSSCEKATYPKERLRESVIELCREEYNTDVDVGIFGKTLAIYLPINNLFDITLNLSEEAQEKIQNVLLGASRIVLSTDAEITFYCMITQDMKLPEIQLVIIKYVDDIKRAFLQDISRNEYFERTIIEISENPQAKKEQAIAKVFEKMKLDKEMQDKVMEDFFRGAPSSLEGIGYWQGKFYMKDITIQEFIAQQMASRIRARFRENEDLRNYMMKSVSSKFVSEPKPSFFLVAFRSEQLLFMIDPAEKILAEKEIFRNIFEEIADVIYGYKFRDFNFVRILEENYQRKLIVSNEDVYLFKQKKLGIESVINTIN